MASFILPLAIHSSFNLCFPGRLIYNSPVFGISLNVNPSLQEYVSTYSTKVL